MNVKFIAAGAALAGAGVGAVVAWAITADRADQRSKTMRDELGRLSQSFGEKTRETSRLELEVERLNIKVDELEHKLYAEDEISPGGDAQEIVSEGTEIEPFPEGETPEETHAKLRSQINQYTAEPGAADFIADAGARVVVESTKHEPPFVISQLQFADDNDDEGTEYLKKTITWYEKARVLLDEDDEVVPQNEIDHMVGWRNLNRFGDQSSDPDTVFVRNRRLDMDFEVVRELDEEPPLYVKLGMDKESYEVNRSAGLIKFREGDV